MLPLRGYIMIGSGYRLVWPENLQATLLQSQKSNRTRHLVDQVPVDVEHIRPPVHTTHHMPLPYLIKQRLPFTCHNA